MRSTTLLAVIAFVLGNRAFAQSTPQLTYTLSVDTVAGTYSVELRVSNAPDTLMLAAAAHSEYDDKYWRYLEDLQVAASRSDAATIARVDSVRWQVNRTGGEVAVRYRVRPPVQPAPRSAWRAFVARNGALLGAHHSFLYVVGAENASAIVTLAVPEKWQVVTGLERRGNAYFAPNSALLMDSPIFAGEVSSWAFNANGLPHRVVYWRTRTAAQFDTATFVNSVERFARETLRLFGSAPYRNYTFIFQDEALGALEHHNSVTLGAPSASLARDPYSLLPETAHEFFHTWNLMQIRPRSYRDLDYRVQPPVSELWFSEGLTIFYADLLMRRAGLPTSDSTRIQRLSNILGRYHSNRGYARFAAEEISRVAYNATPGALGDYSLSTHLQGEVIGAMLDLIVRGATNGQRSMDDVMRLMSKRFSGNTRFVGSDVEQAVRDVCKCDVKYFFDAHVRGASAIDVNRYLGLIGLRAHVNWVPVVSQDGQPAVDLRLRGWQAAPDQKLELLFGTPDNIWVKAGLRTRDKLVSINDRPINTWPEMRSVLTALRIGETAKVTVERPTGPFTALVALGGYNRADIRIEEIETAGARQRALRTAWLQSK